LDSHDLPMGVMRERGMAWCCMIDNADVWVLGERRRLSMRVQVQMQMRWDVLSWGQNCVVQEYRKSRWRMVWNR
jgi:hypothetical protein